MDKTTIIVCAVVGSLGVLSAILGFSAEGTKLTPYTILVYGYDCIYPQNPALGLGICAVIFQLVAQVAISAVGGCCGCCKSRSVPSETKRIVGIVCAVVSWIAAVIAWALLIEGAAWNANVVRVGVAPYCPYLKDGIFAGAGVLALTATALGITSFILLRRQPVEAAAAPPVPAKGEPQLPPTAAQEKPSQQGSPTGESPAEAPQPAVASAPSESPGMLPSPLPQVYVPNETTTQYPVQASPTAPPQPEGYGEVIGKEVARAGVRLVAQVLSDSIIGTPTTMPGGVGDLLVSMATDSTGGGDLQQATN